MKSDKSMVPVWVLDALAVASAVFVAFLIAGIVHSMDGNGPAPQVVTSQPATISGDYSNWVTFEAGADGETISRTAQLDADDAKAIEPMSSDEALCYLDESPLYSVERYDDGTATLSKPYAAKRLLVVDTDISAIPRTDANGASYDESSNSCVLTYDSMKETGEAYEKLSGTVGANNVLVDRKVHAMGASSAYDGWGLSHIHLDEAEEALDDANVSGIQVAVLDSGLNGSHEAFADVDILPASGSFISATTVAPVSNDYSDDNGHGTHVSGIITSATPDSVSLLELKCLDSAGSGNLVDIYLALLYAYQNGADVINMSLGGDMGSSAEAQSDKEIFDRVFQAIIARGGIVFAAAGNDGHSIEEYGTYPAGSPYVVTVGALGTNGTSRAYYSNYGQSLDFVAPGTSITSAWYTSSTATKSDSGTSMAAPYLSAFAADLLSIYPNQSPAGIVSLMEDMSVDLGDSGFDVYFGNGKPMFDTSVLSDLNASYINTEAPSGGTAGELVFRFENENAPSATFSHFLGILVDGAWVSPDNYDAVSGSVVITLHEDFVQSLTQGVHTLTAVFDNGSAVASFGLATVPISKTINASKAVDTEDMAFRFTFSPATPVSGEEGAQAVPRYDSDGNGSIDANDSFVTPGTKTIVAEAMPGDVQTIQDDVILPSPALFGHAGVYAYDVVEVDDHTGDWLYSRASYKLRLYVKNGPNGLEYASPAFKIEALTDDAGAAVPHAAGTNYGPKSDALAFVNSYTATTDLEVSKQVTGAYGNRDKAFPFTLTVTLPSWAPDGSFAVTTTGSDLSGTTTSGANTVVTTSSGAATVTFKLAHGQSLKLSDLPVGTTFSAGETDSTDGVNVYTPSATYFYDGAVGATGDFADATQNYTAALDAQSQPTNSIEVYASAASAAANASTMLGEGAGNLVTVTNDLSNPPSATGILTETAPYIALVAVALTLLVALRSRKRKDDIA